MGNGYIGTSKAQMHIKLYKYLAKFDHYSALSGCSFRQVYILPCHIGITCVLKYTYNMMYQVNPFPT